MVLFPLKLPSEVMTILHDESFILADSAPAENPANMTEWIAPIRAQANTLTASSGIMGKYIATRSPFWIPLSIVEILVSIWGKLEVIQSL